MATFWQRLFVRTAIRAPGVNLIHNYKPQLNKLLLHSPAASFVTSPIGATSWSISNETRDDVPHGVLPSTQDRFRGNTVDSDLIDINPIQFAKQLKTSLDWWRQGSRRAIWFKINIKQSHLIPILAENSFDFHHARDGFVMMVRWISKHETAMIPPFAHTMVGVGGIVVNDNDQILSISEHQSMIPGSWNIPGGYVDPGEHLIDAIIREVFEETGIRTRFESLVHIRHSLNCKYNCSDIYIVMSLSTIIGNPTIDACPREIVDAKWMEFDEFVKHPKVHEINRDLLQQYLNNRRDGMMMVCKEQTLSILQRKYNIFSLARRASEDTKL